MFGVSSGQLIPQHRELGVDEIRLRPSVAHPSKRADALVIEHRIALDGTRREMTVALERRRRELERALHDGAQQQLLALRFEILRVAEVAPSRHDGTIATSPTRQRVANAPLLHNNAAAVDDAVWDVAVAGVVARLDGALEDLGRLASGQRPRALDASNLADAVRELAAISGATTDVFAPPLVVVDEASAEVIAFVVSEALANAQQHSNSSRCAVTVVPSNDGVRVDVADNGRGGALIVPGRGLDGLRRRAELLGGTLEMFSDRAGTLVRLHLPQPKSSKHLTDVTSPESSGGKRGAIDVLRCSLGDDTADLWFWCEPDGSSIAPFGQTSQTGECWKTEDGVVVDRGAIERALLLRGPRSAPRLVQLLEGDRPFALVATNASTERLAGVCRDSSVLLVEARERAVASATLARLREEHNRIARRSQSFEDALRRRLTDRPREELLAARACLTGRDERHLAADHVANATELLREIVRRLRVTDSDWSVGTLTSTLERIARRARVRLDLDADDLDDEAASTLIERVAEEVMLDASPRAAIILRVRAHSRHVMLSIALQRLPSPVAIALLEELALSSGSTLKFRPHTEGVRLTLEVPCES